MNSPALLTTREVAERLGVTPRHVTRMVPSKLKPAYTVPGYRGALLFSPDDVARLEQQRVPEPP